MQDEHTYQIREYREGTDGKVPCPKCRQLIPVNANSCFACGVHFQGCAGDFVTPTKRTGLGFGRFMKYATIVVLIILILCLTTYIVMKNLQGTLG